MKSNYTEVILQNYEATRSDDSLLIYYHLRRHGLYLTPEQLKQLLEICKETVSLYDLVRYRQKFQSEKKYMGNSEVMAVRQRNGVKRKESEIEAKKGRKSKGQLKLHISPDWRERTWVDQGGQKYSAA